MQVPLIPMGTPGDAEPFLALGRSWLAGVRPQGRTRAADGGRP